MENKSPRYAATIIVLVPWKSEEFEYKLLLVGRSRNASSFSALTVFPGGIFENADSNVEWYSILDIKTENSANKLDFSLALKITALRELFEESGVLVTQPRVNSIADITKRRKEVNKDAQQFISLMKEFKCTPRLDIIEWARWITPITEKKRYDTMFYLVILDYIPSASHDEKETISSLWASPKEALQAFSEEKISLAPPTWYMLNELLQFRTLNEIKKMNKKRNLNPIQPKVIVSEDSTALLYTVLPGDHLYNGVSNTDENRIVIKSPNNFELKVKYSQKQPLSKL